MNEKDEVRIDDILGRYGVSDRAERETLVRELNEAHRAVIERPTIERNPGESCSDEDEEEYRRLGWWKGPDAAPESIARGVRYWRGRGAGGARWLARRLRGESHIDVLDGAAGLLADLGDAALGPIVAELEVEPTRDQAEALLKALGWLAEGGHGSDSLTFRLARALDPFLSHDDDDLRARAAGAAVLLPEGLAAVLLRARRSAETVEEVRAAIDDALVAVRGRDRRSC
jgi:hypothetical protein